MAYKQPNKLVDGLTVTATTTYGPFASNGARGIILDIDVSSIGGTTPSYTVKLQNVDPFDASKRTDIPGAVATAVTANGHSTLTVFPGITVAAGSTASNVVGFNYTVVVTVSGAGATAKLTIAAVTMV